MHTQIANKLETDVKLQLYIDPIKLNTSIITTFYFPFCKNLLCT